MKQFGPAEKRKLIAASAVLVALAFVAPSVGAHAVADESPAGTLDIEALSASARNRVEERGPQCGGDPVSENAQRANVFRFTEEPEAGGWATWVVDPETFMPPAPPATGSAAMLAELAELHAIELNRTQNQTLEAQLWDDGAATKAWTELTLQLIIRHAAKDGAKNPPRLARMFAMVETAMFDALVATWNAKYCYERLPPPVVDPTLGPVVRVRPLPSYPSEHAAVAAAAATVLIPFFPCPDPVNDPEHCEEHPGALERLAWNASLSRLVGGANYRSDVEAGFALGKAVGEAVVADRAADGSHLKWDGSGRLTGLCNWIDVRKPEHAAAGPVEPAWGKVRPFLMTTGSQFRAPPPPECMGEDYVAQYRDVYEATKTLTPRQREIAYYWAGGQGTVTPPGQWLNFALNLTVDHDLNTMRTSRVMAHTATALADAGIAAWDTKYTYWFDRPITAIQRMWEPGWTHPTWNAYFATPPFPGYISGHSTFAGAMSAPLTHFFPEDAVQIRSAATEAAMSRFYGGIHFRSDNEVGLMVGGNVGALAVARAMSDGAE